SRAGALHLDARQDPGAVVAGVLLLLPSERAALGIHVPAGGHAAPGAGGGAALPADVLSADPARGDPQGRELPGRAAADLDAAPAGARLLRVQRAAVSEAAGIDGSCDPEPSSSPSYRTTRSVMSSN